MRLICTISRRTSFTTARAGLVEGRSRPMISMTPAIPASGLRISWARPAANSPKRRQVLGARHLCAMQALNFLAALAQLLHHVIEVAAEVSDFVVAPGEADRDIQVAFTDQRDFLLQFDHGPLNEIGERADGHSTDGDRSRSGDHQHRMAYRVPQRYGRNNEQQQPRQQYQYYRQECLELPIEA
jgi:hypothetical protein